MVPRGSLKPLPPKIWWTLFMALLEVKNVHSYYGNIHALKGVSLSVEAGEIVTLIGANGAGKSTTLKTISGIVRPRQGSVYLAGEDLAEYPAHEIVSKGVSQVPEGRGVFARLTVTENLELGAYIHSNAKQIVEEMERVFTLFPRLRERRKQMAGTLSGGEQQMLAMGRGLMAQPKVLLLDEPSMGLAPILVESIFETVQNINKEGGTILLVEQNALMALQIAHRGYVIQTGEIVLEDSAKALQNNDMVRKAYLGVD
jgi:branched-chain amino acid transport system ATP-binding protein